MPQTQSATLRNHPLLSFFVLSYVLSWILWIPLLYGHFKYGWTTWEGDSWTNVRTQLGLLGSLGPMLAAIIMTARFEGGAGVRLLGRRLAQWRVGWRWWITAFYVWWLIGSVLAVGLGLVSAGMAGTQFGFSVINIPVIIFVLQLPLLVGMIGEEVGWRGFALPRLLENYNPVTASLLLAAGWLFWHAPLAVFPEWRGELPVMLFAIRYVLLVVPLTLIFTWFFQKTRGSILLVIVFHKALNLTFNAIASVLGLSGEGSKMLMNGLIAVLWVWAMVLTIGYLRKTPEPVAESSISQNQR